MYQNKNVEGKKRLNRIRMKCQKVYCSKMFDWRRWFRFKFKHRSPRANWMENIRTECGILNEIQSKCLEHLEYLFAYFANGTKCSSALSLTAIIFQCMFWILHFGCVFSFCQRFDSGYFSTDFRYVADVLFHDRLSLFFPARALSPAFHLSRSSCRYSNIQFTSFSFTILTFWSSLAKNHSAQIKLVDFLSISITSNSVFIHSRLCRVNTRRRLQHLLNRIRTSNNDSMAMWRWICWIFCCGLWFFFVACFVLAHTFVLPIKFVRWMRYSAMHTIDRKPIGIERLKSELNKRPQHNWLFTLHKVTTIRIQSMCSQSHCNKKIKRVMERAKKTKHWNRMLCYAP